jgi:hypothetical protein
MKKQSHGITTAGRSWRFGIAAVGLGSIAWTGNHQNNSYQSIQDTIPRQKNQSRPLKEFKKDLDKSLMSSTGHQWIFAICPTSI